MTQTSQMATMTADDNGGVGTDEGVLLLDSNWHIYHPCTSSTSRETELQSWKMPNGLKTLMNKTVKPSQDGSGEIQMEEKLCFFSLLCTSNFSDFHVTWCQKSSNHISYRPQQPHKLFWVERRKNCGSKYHHWQSW